MKNIYILIVLFFSGCALMNAQVSGKAPQADIFDPGRDPVALRTDSSLQLLISEYVLSKSVKASIGRSCQVLKTYKTKMPDGSEHLIFEGSYLEGGRQPFMLDVLLSADAQARFYYASSQNFTVCSTSGCSNCVIEQDTHKCLGCCEPLPDGFVPKAPLPLMKVKTTIDE